MASLKKWQLIRPGHQVASTLNWTSRATGRLVATVLVAVDLRDLAAASIRLVYTVDRDGRPIRGDCRVGLEATEPAYGGLRWWFLCPLSGRRVRVLCLPPGSTVFAGRHALGLGYRSQRQTDADRATARARAARRKLGLTGPDLLEAPNYRRPKGMHGRTYIRLVRAAEEARRALWATAPIR